MNESFRELIAYLLGARHCAPTIICKVRNDYHYFIDEEIEDEKGRLFFFFQGFTLVEGAQIQPIVPEPELLPGARSCPFQPPVGLVSGCARTYNHGSCQPSLSPPAIMLGYEIQAALAETDSFGEHCPLLMAAVQHAASTHLFKWTQQTLTEHLQSGRTQR